MTKAIATLLSSIHSFVSLSPLLRFSVFLLSDNSKNKNSTLIFPIISKTNSSSTTAMLKSNAQKLSSALQHINDLVTALSSMLQASEVKEAALFKQVEEAKATARANSQKKLDQMITEEKNFVSKDQALATTAMKKIIEAQNALAEAKKIAQVG